MPTALLKRSQKRSQHPPLPRRLLAAEAAGIRALGDAYAEHLTLNAKERRLVELGTVRLACGARRDVTRES